jgi:hypothetical protein
VKLFERFSRSIQDYLPAAMPNLYWVARSVFWRPLCSWLPGEILATSRQLLSIHWRFSTTITRILRWRPDKISILMAPKIIFLDMGEKKTCPFHFFFWGKYAIHQRTRHRMPVIRKY